MISKKLTALLLILSACLIFSYEVQAQVRKITLSQIEAVLKEKDSRTPIEKKIDSRLLHFAAGEYFVRIETATGLINLKFIKQ